MVKPVYYNTTKRWQYNSDNDKLEINDPTVPLMDERLIFSLKNVLNDYYLIEREEYYISRSRAERPFLVTHERFLYPGSEGAVIIENDPVNTIEAALDTAVIGNPEVEAERMIGNLREGLKRKIVHLGDSPTILEYSDLENASQSTVPFFPPLPLTPSEYDTPPRVLIESSDYGYKRYVKSANPVADDPSALEAKEVTGYKIIIYDPTDTNLEIGSDISNISATDSKNVKVDDIETILNAALSGVHANLETFLPKEKQYQIINIPGRTIHTLDDTGLHIKQYTADFATLVSSITMLHATGDIVLTAGTTVITAAKNGTATLNANGSKIEVLTGGVININAGSNQVNIDASNVDVTVSGTMDVN